MRTICAQYIPAVYVGLVLFSPMRNAEASGDVPWVGCAGDSGIGIILQESMRYLAVGDWWLAVFPGAMLVATVLFFDLLGGSVRKIADPYSAQQ
jgi:peptide/nickel transport system permease protein